MRKRIIRFLDENKDGVISFKSEFIPFLYTVYVGYMVFKEAQFMGDVFSDVKFIAITGGSLGIEFIRAMAAIYKTKNSKTIMYDEVPENPIDSPDGDVRS